MARYVFHGTARDGAGNVITSATVSVYLNGTTTAASVYTASSGGTAVNSVTSSSTDGSFYFYVDTSDYASTQKFKVIITKTGYASKTYDDLSVLPVQTTTSVKIGSGTRALNAASGNVSYTGVGFAPTHVIFLGAVDNYNISVGIDDATSHHSVRSWAAGGTSYLFARIGGASLALMESSTAYQEAYIYSLDADGFTLTWTKSGSPSSDTAYFYYLALG